ncbi:MAG: hypothetical protein WCC86_05890 [Methanoregula sp.]
MDKKPRVKPGESVTKVDAGDLRTNREKARDGMSTEDIRTADWGKKKRSP